MAEIQCFLIEPTDRRRLWLRRYRDSNAERATGFPGHSYHQARVLIGEGPALAFAEREGRRGIEPSVDPADYQDDPRWPTACECGEPFTEADHWQVFTSRIYRRVDTGEEMVLAEAPVGAMWRAPWFEPQWVGPDGHCYVLMTPAREWVIDGPSTNGGGWTRTGEAPRFTVTPSIGQQAPDGSWLYHGFLTDGVLRDA